MHPITEQHGRILGEAPAFRMRPSTTSSTSSMSSSQQSSAAPPREPRSWLIAFPDCTLPGKETKAAILTQGSPELVWSRIVKVASRGVLCGLLAHRPRASTTTKQEVSDSLMYGNTIPK